MTQKKTTKVMQQLTSFAVEVMVRVGVRARLGVGVRVMDKA
jgi:hypothetical protein